MVDSRYCCGIVEFFAMAFEVAWIYTMDNTVELCKARSRMMTKSLTCTGTGTVILIYSKTALRVGSTKFKFLVLPEASIAENTPHGTRYHQVNLQTNSCACHE